MNATARIALIAALLAALCGCVSTPAFRDASGHVIPGSVASMERIRIGGIEQSVWFRGIDTRKPALVLLHGGPGASEAALFRHYDAALEQHFLVVYWEQRGAGRSYAADIPPASMTLAQFERDLDELIAVVKARFGKRKVVLLGHSWGTELGTLYAYHHPENVAAYVGVSQVANFAQGERMSYEWALAAADARGDRAAAEALRAMAPAPRSVDDELTKGEYVERFGGVFHRDMSTGDLILAALCTSEASILDLVRFGQGNRFSLEALRPAYAQLDLTPLRRFEVPVFFFLGRHDWQTPAVLAERYFQTIDAPHKRLVWFEQSAHNAPFEEPERFVQVMRDVVLPAVTASTPE